MDQTRDNPGETPERRSVTPGRFTRLFGTAFVHLTGVFAVAVLAAWLIVGTGHLRWLASAHGTVGDSSMFAAELATHLGVAAAGWAILYGVFRGLLSRGTRGPRTVKRARGTVIVETLVVFPVLLLLVMGIAQLAVNNIAGLLLNYGASQGVQSAWVWESEVRGRDTHGMRMGVEEAKIEEMARIQIAAAMTPVAPSVFDANRSIDSEEFENMRAAFLGGQLEVPPNEAGQAVLAHTEQFDDFEPTNRPTFVRSLDDASFPRRTVRKFTSAYRAVDLEVESTGDDIEFDLDYHHQITFPLVGPIFANPGGIEGSPGNYLTMSREISHTAQIAPNAKLPRR